MYTLIAGILLSILLLTSSATALQLQIINEQPRLIATFDANARRRIIASNSLPPEMVNLSPAHQAFIWQRLQQQKNRWVMLAVSIPLTPEALEQYRMIPGIED